jgi:hypothetical protein
MTDASHPDLAGADAAASIGALALTNASAPPGFMRLLPRTPIVRKLPPRSICFSVWPVCVKE